MSYSTANLTPAEKAIRSERTRQYAKWGAQNHEPAIWLAILGEEFGELSQAVLADLFGKADHGSHHESLRAEAVQVAAVAVAFIEYLDRRPALAVQAEAQTVGSSDG